MRTQIKHSAILGIIYLVAFILILTAVGRADVTDWLKFIIIVCVLAIVFMFSALIWSGNCSKEEGYK